MGPSTLKARTDSVAEAFGFRRCSQQTVQKAAGGHGPWGKQDVHRACSPQSPLFLAPRARHGLHGPPSACSSDMRALGFLPQPWRPHTHRPASLSALRAPHRPHLHDGSRALSPRSSAAQQATPPTLPKCPGSPPPPSSALKAQAESSTQRQPFQSPQRPTELSRQFSAFGCP